MSWIDSVPTGWQVKRLKYLGTARNGLTYAPEDVVDDGILVLRSSNIQNNALSFDDNVYVNKRIPHEIVLREKDLLICSRNGSSDLIGKCALIDKEMAGNTYGAFMCVYRSPNNMFVYWVLLSDIFSFYLSSYLTSTISQLTNANLLNIEILVPPLTEQRAIAAFLDDRCSYIDGVFTDLERQVEIMRQYKKTLITETVTKGLDKSAPMKDSGMDWIGETPRHWEVKKIKYCANKIGSGKTPLGGSEIYEQEGVTFIRSQNVYDDGLRLDDVVYIHPSIDNSMASTRVFHNDVLFNITGASIGRCCMYNLPDRANVNQHVCIIRTNSKLLLPEFLRYVLNSTIGQMQVILCQLGGNRESVTFEQLGMFNIVVPPTNEQQAIVDRLNSVCAETDALIAEKQRSVDTIRQYRRSLIYEYVTGKKRVAS